MASGAGPFRRASAARAASTTSGAVARPTGFAACRLTSGPTGPGSVSKSAAAAGCSAADGSFPIRSASDQRLSCGRAVGWRSCSKATSHCPSVQRRAAWAAVDVR